MANNNETTTRFKADISELKRAMQEAQRQVRLANSEFQAATAGMNDWQNSADGVSAKIRNLESVLSAQNNKLQLLSRQYALTAQEMGADSRAAQELQIQINNQRAAIARTRSELETYTDTLANMGSELSDADSASEELADSVGDAAGSAESAVGGFTVLKGALANLVAEGISKAIGALKDLTVELINDSSNAYAQFASSTGIATDAMGEYEEAIKSVYKNNFGESLTDVAEKMAKVKEITGELDAGNLQKMTEKAITLEDVFGMDMTESLRGVQNLMTHFGMTSDEAFDYISSGAQNGLNYTDELGDNIAEYAGKFAEAGYTADEYFQLLQNGSDGGAYNLDKVNDAINEVTTRLADDTIGDSIGSFSTDTQNLFTAWQNGGATQKQVIDSIVKDIQNTTGEQEKMNLAALAFGTMAEDGGTKFIESLTSVGNTYDDVNGKAEELANIKYDTPAAAIAGIGRTLKTDLLQPMVDKLMPYLNQAADWVTENLPLIIEKVKEVGEKIKEVINFIDLISPALAALGVAIAGIGIIGLIQNLSAIGLALKTWAASTKLVTAAQWLLNTAMSANPIGLIVVAIAALVAAFVLLWNKSEKFREFWIGLWEKIKEAASGAGEWIKNAFDEVIEFFTVTVPKVFNDVINFFKDNWQALLLLLVNPFAGGFKLLYDNCEGFREFIDGFVQKIKDFFTNAWDEIVEFFTTDIPNFIDEVIQWFEELPENLGYLIGQAIGHVAKFGVDLFNFAKTEIPKFIDKVIEFFKTLPGKTWDWLKQTWDKIKTWGQEIVKTGKEKASDFITSVINFVKELPGKVWTWLFSTITKVKDWGQQTVETGKKKASEFVESAISFFKEIPGKTYNAIKDTVTKVINWGKDLVSKGKEAGSNLVKTVSDEVSALPGKMLSIGGDLVKGLWNGISDMGGWIKDQIFGFGDSIIEGFKSVFDINSPSKVMEKLIGNNIVYGFVNGVTEKTKEAVSAMSELADKSMEPLKNMKADITGNIAPSIGMGSAHAAANQGGTVNNYNFVQNNTSPKSLSRLEIYRQTKNQLLFAKGV